MKHTVLLLYLMLLPFKFKERFVLKCRKPDYIMCVCISSHPSYIHDSSNQLGLVKLGNRTKATGHFSNQQVALCNSHTTQHQRDHYSKCNETAHDDIITVPVKLPAKTGRLISCLILICWIYSITYFLFISTNFFPDCLKVF